MGRGVAVTELVLTIISEFAKDLKRPLTINKLATECGKAYANVHATTTQLLEKKILTKEVVGHAHNCTLNLESDTALLYLSLVQLRKRDKILRGNPGLQEETTELFEDDNILCVWKTEARLLLITKEKGAYPHKNITVEDFLEDKELRATIGQHTLLAGHAHYISIMRPLEVYR